MKYMVKELIAEMMVENMLGIGKTIRWMVKAYMFGRMVGAIMEIMLMEKNMEMEFLPDPMEKLMRVNGIMVNNMELDFIVLME